MPKLNPQTKGNELLEELSKYSVGKKPSEFETRRFLRDADNIKKANLSQGWMLSGIIYALNQKYDDSIHAFETALKLGTSDFDACIENYTRSLRNLGRPYEALSVAEKYAVEDNYELLECVVSNANYLGLFDKAGVYLEKMKAFNSQNNKDNKSRFAEYVNEVTTIAKELGVSETHYSAIHCIALDSIYDAKKTLVKSSIYMMEDSASLEFYVDADTDTIFEISMSVINKLAEVDDIPAVVNGTLLPSISAKKTVDAD